MNLRQGPPTGRLFALSRASGGCATGLPLAALSLFVPPVDSASSNAQISRGWHRVGLPLGTHGIPRTSFCRRPGGLGVRPGGPGGHHWDLVTRSAHRSRVFCRTSGHVLRDRRLTRAEQRKVIPGFQSPYMTRLLPLLQRRGLPRWRGSQPTTARGGTLQEGPRAELTT